MKAIFLYLLITMPTITIAQESLSMEAVEGRREVSMADSFGKSNDGIYRYYAKGEDKPYTGILYGNHPNGNLASWQEYVDGVGQGKWINYYENGNYIEIGYYEQNEVTGPITKFHSNGKVKAEGTYKDWRVMIGEWKYYDQDGKLDYIKNYGKTGSIEEVQEYYERGDISYSWYSSILTKNGFKL